MTESGEVSSVAYGPCPRNSCPLQTNPEAEDYVAAILREIALPPLVLYADCVNTVRAVNDEGIRAKRSVAPRAHLWSAYNATFEGAGVTAQHVKVHATQRQAEDGTTSWWKKLGNDTADHYAKLGARMHGVTAELAEEYQALHYLAAQLATYLAVAAAKAADQEHCDTTPTQEWSKRVQQEEQLPFELELDGGDGARTIPPPIAGQNVGEAAAYFFQGHHLLTATYDAQEELSAWAIVYCRRCGPCFCMPWRAVAANRAP